MADQICPVCGLPKPSLCVCGQIEKEEQKIKIFIEERRFRKKSTIIQGIKNGKEVSKQLKAALACGGTYKDDHIELQGDHKARILPILKKMGYDEDQIEVS
jgi:translation initiation factor 1